MGGAVEVWHIRLAAGSPDDMTLADAVRLDEALLDDQERARAARFHRPDDRTRYVIAHAALRRILARAMGCAAAGIRYGFGAGGKPLLPGSRLGFNLSHAGDDAVVAMVRDGEVGIDIEQAPDDADHLAGQILSADELAEYRRLPAADRPQAFARAWTRKEAVLKAVGCGLGRDQREVSVGLGVSGHAESGAVVIDGHRWHFRDFTLAGPMTGCLAANGPLPPITLRPYDARGFGPAG